LNFDIRISDLIGKIMAGEKILLVEDNEVNRRLAGFLLRSKSYQVREATTAKQAFEILNSERVDLILMDIQLPEMDGLEATAKLKAQPATAKIPVIAVTSYAMAGDREKALAAGCSGYVTKPIDKTLFLAEVSRHLK
jgi:two-component system cell cycle response regulator DivK